MWHVQPRPSTVAIVLGAGAGRRFGGPKPLAELADQPLVIHVVKAARAAGVDSIIVVTGEHDAAIRASLADEPDVVVTYNPLAKLGQSVSLAVGLEAATACAADAAVLLLADEPTVEPSVIATVIAAAADGKIARAVYRDGPGHPVVLPRAYWEEIGAGVFGDAGARTILTHLAVRDVPIDMPRPPDIDEPADLHALADALASRTDGVHDR